MKFDIVALGELLVDLTPAGERPGGGELLEICPGGAPANALAMAARLGSRTAFLGKVGDDAFGHKLARALVQAGVDCGGLRFDPRHATTLAVVQLDENGERSFAFYREPGADTQLAPEEVDEDTIRAAALFHFGTLSLSSEPAASATRHALELARAAGCTVSFDPNLRPALWPDEAAMRAAADWGLARCDLAKLADDELAFLTGHVGEQGEQALLRRYPRLRALFVTCGADGCRVRLRGGEAVSIPAFPAEVVDTTGAGDCFFGCCLHWLSGVRPEYWTEELLVRAARWGAAASSLVIGRRGALLQMPTREEVGAILSRKEMARADG